MINPELHDALLDHCGETSAAHYASACDEPDMADFDFELIEDELSEARLEALDGAKPNRRERKLFKERHIEEQLSSEAGPRLFAFFRVPIHPGSGMPGWIVPDDVTDSEAREQEADKNVKIFVGWSDCGNFSEPLDDFDGPFDTSFRAGPYPARLVRSSLRGRNCPPHQTDIVGLPPSSSQIRCGEELSANQLLCDWC